jgi:hypothetical protein
VWLSFNQTERLKPKKNRKTYIIIIMNKSFALAVITALCFGMSFGQQRDFGIKTGINSSMFNASINSTPSRKSGFHLGFFIRSKIKDKVNFRPELYYSAQGQKDKYDNNGGSTTTSVNYLNLPLLFEFGNKVSFHLGPQAGFLLSAREKGTIGGDPVDSDLKDTMKKAPELSLILGLNANLSKRVCLGARFNAGLSSIFLENEIAPGVTMPPVKNGVLHFYIGVALNKNGK